MTFIEQTLGIFAETLGVSFPDLILILIVLSCLILFGVSIRIGLMFSTVLLSLFFVVFYLTGLQTTNILMAMVISYILLTLSFFIKPNPGGGAF